MGRDNGDPLNTLKLNPGQTNNYVPKFHPLPGQWAKDQLLSGTKYTGASTNPGSKGYSKQSTEIDKALAAEKEQHRYWEQWQGITPGKPEYVDPRAWQDTLLPVAKYGTDGRGD